MYIRNMDNTTKKKGRPVKPNKPEMIAFTIRVPKLYEPLLKSKGHKTKYAANLIIKDLLNI